MKIFLRPTAICKGGPLNETKQTILIVLTTACVLTKQLDAPLLNENERARVPKRVPGKVLRKVHDETVKRRCPAKRRSPDRSHGSTSRQMRKKVGLSATIVQQASSSSQRRPYCTTLNIPIQSRPLRKLPIRLCPLTKNLSQRYSNLGLEKSFPRRLLTA